MPDESTTPDLVAQTRRLVEAGNRREFDVQASIFAPDAVFDLSPMGLGIYRGRVAIREVFEEMRRPYAEVLTEVEENLNLGEDIGFATFVLTGRLIGSGGELRMRYAGVGLWADGLMQRGWNYLNADEARAAAGRLAQERTDG